MGQHYDVMVIGAGPGGYVAAIRAAKLGLHVAVVEEDRAGGTCLNRGCIPAKAMIHAAETYRSAREADQFGVETGRVSFDYGKILAYKEETTDALVQGVEQLLAGNGVDRLAGKGTLLAGKKVRVTTEEKEEVYAADHIILAAGSKPLLLPIPGMDLPGVLTSDGLFRLQECPESLAIIGGGVISVEFATAFAGLGTKVTILEALPRLVPNLDKEISQNLKMILKKRGVDIHTSASVQEVAEEDGRYVLRFTEKEKEQEVSARYVLCAVGRVPNTEGLFAEDALPDMERGRVLVDEKFETSIPGVYAIGDLIFGMQLAHTASAQGTVVAEHLAKERLCGPFCGSLLCLHRSGDRLGGTDRRGRQRAGDPCAGGQVHYERQREEPDLQRRAGIREDPGSRGVGRDPGSSDDVRPGHRYDRRAGDGGCQRADRKAAASWDAGPSHLQRRRRRGPGGTGRRSCPCGAPQETMMTGD